MSLQYYEYDDCKHCGARYSVKCDVREYDDGTTCDKYSCTECKKTWSIDGIDS